MAALGGDGLRLLSVSRPERQPESAALSSPGPGLCCWVSVFSCFSLACSYVGSLYVWKSELPRDHPAVIKRRFTSVLVVSSLSPLCVLLWRELTGIQILFLGPLMQLCMDCPCDLTDGLKVVLGESSRLSKSPSFLGPPPHRHALATKPSYSTLDRGAGVPGLYAAHASTMHRSGPCCVHLPTVFWSRVPVLLHRCLRCLYGFPLHPHRTPDRAGSLPLLLQLHGLPCCVCSPGASTEVATAGGLCPWCGTLPASASTPDRPQALWQPSSLYAFGTNGGLRDPTVLLTITLV
ncbi:CAAX prenyl protease 2 isoform X6 [Rattus norvegicus]|uniref:CAAX prenyl protease 2 isoform X6 n=1 Tax=Rattus norvegicus TaxID=10116 RepID=UPI0003D0A5E1|nr:CAAX prenyl protease 2 isoform X6 [Rattus norvegicus]